MQVFGFPFIFSPFLLHIACLSPEYPVPCVQKIPLSYPLTVSGVSGFSASIVLTIDNALSRLFALLASR